MNKILKKIAAIITTAALFISIYVPIAAQAATVNSMRTIGTLSKSNPYGYELDIQEIDLSGKMALCIEPNDDMHRGDTYTQDQADKYWQNTLSQTQRDVIGLILYYGYYNSSSENQSKAYLAATQILLWEVTGYNQSYKTVAPLRTFNFESCTTSCSKSLLDYYIKSTL